MDRLRPRSRISTIQARLGMVQDPMKRRLIDNILYLISDAVDCLRCRYRTTYEGDTTSVIVEKADVVQVSFPPLTDLPYRKIKVDPDTQSWQLTSLISAFEEDMQQKAYTCQIPYEFDADVGDMIFRIFVDPDNKFPCIVPLQIQELLGVFGHHMIIMNKFNATIPTDVIPQPIIDTIHNMAIRRLKINY